MIDAEAENIIDVINRLSQAADKILDTEGLQPEEAFSGVRYFLGRYCDSPDGITVILDTDTLQSCRRRIISGSGDYYSAIEYIPEKTKKKNPRTVKVYLHPTALAIIGKYEGELNDDKALLPLISQQKYNDAIKKSSAPAVSPGWFRSSTPSPARPR